MLGRASCFLSIFAVAAAPLVLLALGRLERSARPGSTRARVARIASVSCLWVGCNVSFLTMWGVLFGRAIVAIASPDWAAAVLALELLAFQPVAILLVRAVVRDRS